MSSTRFHLFWPSDCSATTGAHLPSSPISIPIAYAHGILRQVKDFRIAPAWLFRKTRWASYSSPTSSIWLSASSLLSPLISFPGAFRKTSVPFDRRNRIDSSVILVLNVAAGLQPGDPLGRKAVCIQKRIDALDWNALRESLSARGFVVTTPILTAPECQTIVALYNDETRFRSHIIMERHRFGLGDYKYFGHPLPEIVLSLRTSAYPHLAEVANQWAEALGESRPPYPSDHSAFLKICHKAGQTRPTPLVLHYEAGGYNCLHQDLYGEVAFPLQMVFLLGQPGRDWQGGEFVLVEQQPHAQSKAEVVPADLSQAILFTTRYRPVNGSRGHYRVNLRHAVSRVHRGTRFTLGIIFHDAK